jgi:hypothetical protein
VTPPVHPAGRAPVLVVASFPPVATAGAAVAVQVVRDLWAGGEEVVTVSPRASAARLNVAVAGVLAGRRLTRLRLHTGARRLVLCAERGFPVPDHQEPAWALPGIQQVTVRGLAEAMAGFEHVTLVGCGQTAVPPRLWDVLAAAAGEVRLHPDATGTPGITPLGPSEHTPADLGIKAVSVAGRALLGPRAPQARAAAARYAHAARRLRSRAAG